MTLPPTKYVFETPTCVHSADSIAVLLLKVSAHAVYRAVMTVAFWIAPR